MHKYLLLGALTFSHASVIYWDGKSNISPLGHDSIVVAHDFVSIEKSITLPAHSTLWIKAKYGISFRGSAKIQAMTSAVHVILDADFDANSLGQIQCNKEPCIELTGDSSSIQVYESFENLATALQNSKKPRFTAKAARLEYFIQLNSEKDLIDYAQIQSKEPVYPYFVSLGQSVRLRQPWQPIHSQNQGPVSGVFDGRKNLILGLNVDQKDQDYVGLFAKAQNMEIRHLGIDSAKMSGRSYVGIMAGQLSHSRLYGCFVGGSVQGEVGVGGIVGHTFESKLTDVHSQVYLRGLRHVGGIIGLMTGRSLLSRTWSLPKLMSSEKQGTLVGSVWEDSKIEAAYISHEDGAAVGECLNSKCENQALSLELLSLKSTYESFDFHDLWTIQEHKSLPYLGGFKPLLDHKSKQNSIQNFQSSNDNHLNQNLERSVNGATGCVYPAPCIKMGNDL